MSTYEEQQLARVLAHGPADGEAWYRVKVTGAVETKWLTIHADQVAALAAILAREQ